MRDRFPNSTSALFRSMGGLRRPSAPAAPKPSAAKPLYTRGAKQQEEQYLKIAGGQKYFKSPLKQGLKKELKDFEHHQFDQMTKEERYALSKMKFGGAINKERAKTMAAAAYQIAQKYKHEAGGLAQGLNTARPTEGAKRLMKMEQTNQPQPEPVKPVNEATAGDRIAGLREQLHIQHAAITDRPAAPNVPSITNPTPLPQTPAGWTTAEPKAPVGLPNEHGAAPAPSAPRLNQFSEGFTGGAPTDIHQHDDQPAPASPIPTLRPVESGDTPVPAPAPASPAPDNQLPSTADVDKDLPF